METSCYSSLVHLQNFGEMHPVWLLVSNSNSVKISVYPAPCFYFYDFLNHRTLTWINLIIARLDRK